MKVIRARGWKVVYVILGDLGIAAFWLRPRDWSFQFKVYPVCVYIDIGPLQIGIMRRRKEDGGIGHYLGANLRAKGWRHVPGRWYQCRICKSRVSPWRYAWLSPKGTLYHEYCLSQSPMALKDMKGKKDALEN